MLAFITGSRAYGTPSRKSDVDLVVRMDLETMQKLQDFSETADTIVFGKLNIIPCLSDEEFACWRIGTTQMINKKYNEKDPSDRADAIKIMNVIRRLAGVEDRHDSQGG